MHTAFRNSVFVFVGVQTSRQFLLTNDEGSSVWQFTYMGLRIESIIFPSTHLCVWLHVCIFVCVCEPSEIYFFFFFFYQRFALNSYIMEGQLFNHTAQ